MSITKIILSIIVVTYGTNGSLLPDQVLNKNSPGGYYDTLGDYYVQGPIIIDSYNPEDNELDEDYAENSWERDGNTLERQLPQSGYATLPQEKKSQTWCKLQKEKIDLSEPGFEVFPKFYIEYNCVAYHGDGTSENSIFGSSDTCAVKDVKCKSLQKPFVYFKWPIGARTTFCDLTKVEKTVKVGCNCVHHVKYHFQ